VRFITKRLLLSASLVSLAGCASAGGSTPAGVPGTVAGTSLARAARSPQIPPNTIKHVIIILQENRSTDNLFHGLPGADTANSGYDSHGNQIPLVPIHLAQNFDQSHLHQAFLNAYNNGQMNGANLNKPQCVGGKHCGSIPPNANYSYVPRSDVAEYFSLAEEFTFGDEMFQTNQGQSYPAHQFIIAGTSAPSTGSNLFVADNPIAGTAGCTAPRNSLVPEIDPAGHENQTTYPCFEHATLMDELDAQNLTWKYYANSGYSIWNAPNSIQHIRLGPDWNNDVVPETRILQDIRNGNLANVSWVNPNANDSDHPGINDGSGPSWVASIVNAIGQSADWRDTAVFVTWDDWGGWYDHVAPSVINSYEYGLRVPLIVASPYAKNGYVSHVTHDFGSILKFTEEAFGLPSLGYADSLADDLSDCFDFGAKARKFRPIPSRHDADWFINHRAPTAPIEDD